jgi:hypothetical protein
VDIERSPLIKGYTGMTVVTGLPIRAHILAIDRLCQDPGTGCLTNPPGTAKKESMRQLAIFNSVFQGSSDMGLAHNRRKILGPVFSGADYEFIHYFSSCLSPREGTVHRV